MSYRLSVIGDGRVYEVPSSTFTPIPPGPEVDYCEVKREIDLISAKLAEIKSIVIGYRLSGEEVGGA